VPSWVQKPQQDIIIDTKGNQEELGTEGEMCSPAVQNPSPRKIFKSRF